LDFDWLSAATKTGTLLLVLLCGVIAPADFSFEPLVNSSFEGKDRQTALPPDLIVPAQKGRREQSAKNPVLKLLFGN